MTVYVSKGRRVRVVGQGYIVACFHEGGPEHEELRTVEALLRFLLPKLIFGSIVFLVPVLRYRQIVKVPNILNIVPTATKLFVVKRLNVLMAVVSRFRPLLITITLVVVTILTFLTFKVVPSSRRN